jgi:ribosomal protein L37AE/L43A
MPEVSLYLRFVVNDAGSRYISLTPVGPCRGLTQAMRRALLFRGPDCRFGNYLAMTGNVWIGEGTQRWESVHVCPNCGHVINLAELDLRAITTGIVTCPNCDWSGQIEIQIIDQCRMRIPAKMSPPKQITAPA